jgi:hypothetical protein
MHQSISDAHHDATQISRRGSRVAMAASPSRTFTPSPIQRFNNSIRRWTNLPWRTIHAAFAERIAENIVVSLTR